MLAVLLIAKGSYKLDSDVENDIERREKLNSEKDEFGCPQNYIGHALANLMKELEDKESMLNKGFQVDDQYIEILNFLIKELLPSFLCFFFCILKELGIYYPLDTDSLIDLWEFMQFI
jgi:hypothetical protein